jgi:hypothetical protein
LSKPTSERFRTKNLSQPNHYLNLKKHRKLFTNLTTNLIMQTKRIAKCLLLFALIFGANTFLAQAQCTFTAIASGDWMNPAIWSVSPADCPNNLPGPNDHVIIGCPNSNQQPCYTVTLNSGTEVQVASLHLRNRANSGGTLIVQNSPEGDLTHLIVGPTGGTNNTTLMMEGQTNLVIDGAVIQVTGALGAANQGNIISGGDNDGYLLIERCARQGASVNTTNGSCPTRVVSDNNVGNLTYCTLCPADSPPADCDTLENGTQISSNGVTPLASSPTACGEIYNLLPVEFLYFKAIYRKDEGVELMWKTISEKDNDYFQVERAVGNSSFQAIGRIEGKGNSNNLNAYSFWDREYTNGIIYYRLKQVDFDGTYAYSKVVAVRIENAPLSQAVAYPNPSDGKKICLRLEAQEQVYQVQVFNIVGQRMGFQYEDCDGSHANELNLEFENKLLKGTYFIQVITNKRQTVSRFLVE